MAIGLLRWPGPIESMICNRESHMTNKRRTFLKAIYDNASSEIRQAILGDKPEDQEEIDIETPYKRSTRTLGQYVTLDWEHRINIIDLKSKITDYSEDPTLRRPHNFIMMAEPGSGKSFFIKCLAQSLDSAGVSAVSFNMANLHNTNDLLQPLDAVRNLKVVDRLPLLFLDEFDSDPHNYSLLLPLLWDGELHLGHRNLNLGKVVIVLAGSNPEINKVMNDAKSMTKKVVPEKSDSNDGSSKLVDLLSRINGGCFEIPDLDLVNRNRNRLVDKICVTISLLQGRFGPRLQLVPWCLLRFVASTRFRYGVRSIAHLVELISWNSDISNKLDIGDIHLPLTSEKELKNSSLAYHLVSEEGPEGIVETWKDTSSCSALVRYRSTDEEDDI